MQTGAIIKVNIFFLGQTASWVSVSDDKYDSDFEFLYAYVSQICLQ